MNSALTQTAWWKGSKRVHWLHFREEPPCVTQDQQRWGRGGVISSSDSARAQVTKWPQIELSCGCLADQWCPSLCNTLDCSLSGSSVRGIFQARLPERIAISFSREPSRPRDHICISCIGKQILHHLSHQESPFLISCACVFLLSRLSHVRLCATLTVAFQAPLSMGFSRQEYWSGLSGPPPGVFPVPGI